MNHEVVPRPCKICNWLLTSSWDHYGLHQGKNGQSDHVVWGPHKTYLKAYVIHSHGPTGFVVGETKEVIWQKKHCYNDFLKIDIFFEEDKRKTREDKRMVKRELLFTLKTTTFFGHMLETSTPSIYDVWSSFLLVHIRFTPCEGPKGFVEEIGPRKLDHEKGHLLWSDFMVHGVNQSLCKLALNIRSVCCVESVSCIVPGSLVNCVKSIGKIVNPFMSQHLVLPPPKCSTFGCSWGWSFLDMAWLHFS